MPIAWRSAAETFEQILRKHGVRSEAVTDVEAAWQAFVDFAQMEISGVDEEDDGFIVQWGRRSWDDNRLILTLTRQLSRPDNEEEDLVQVWQVELEIAFDDEPALAELESDVDAADTGFRFEPVGPLRTAALAEAFALARQQALVRALWTATPVSSSLTFEHVC